MLWTVIGMLAMAPAQEAASAPAPVPGQPPQRVRNATVYGEERCPEASSPDEIVVCARVPETERYRIPRQFRELPSEDAAAQSWVNRTEVAMEANRVGMPNSCSAVGTGGLTGCMRTPLDQWAAGRRMQRRDAARIP